MFFYFTVKLPFIDDVKDPQKKGMIGTRNFYITVNKDIKLGAWYVMYNQQHISFRHVKIIIQWSLSKTNHE